MKNYYESTGILLYVLFYIKSFLFLFADLDSIMVDFLSQPALQTEHTKPNIRRSRLELQNKLISLYILLTKYFCLYPIVKNSVENYTPILSPTLDSDQCTVTNCVRLSLTIRTHATSDFSLTI